MTYISDRGDHCEMPVAPWICIAWSMIVQTFSGTLMTEMQLALCCTLAVGAFARFLASGARSALALFALAAVAGILTKGNAMALALLPPFAIALHGSWRLVRRPALWLAGLAVAHDRAITIFPDRRDALRSQYALLGLMVLYTVGGLWVLSRG